MAKDAVVVVGPEDTVAEGVQKMEKALITLNTRLNLAGVYGAASLVQTAIQSLGASREVMARYPGLKDLKWRELDWPVSGG